MSMGEAQSAAGGEIATRLVAEWRMLATIAGAAVRHSLVGERKMQSVQGHTIGGVMAPIGPYSQIARIGPWIALSAMAGVDPDSGELVGSDAYSQARQILIGLRRLLGHCGCDFAQVLHVQVYLRSMADYEAMNRAYREALAPNFPARSVVAVSELPKAGALLTMSLTAIALDPDVGW